MNLLFTLTSYLPAVGGAQSLMHELAVRLAKRHRVQVLTQWDSYRTDWLLGTTLNAPAQAKTYAVDGVAVHQMSLPQVQRRALRPWVWAYFALQGPALGRIAGALALEIEPWAVEADLVHNCRIGREGLSYASLRVARAREVPYVLTPLHHPRWGGWLHRYYQRLYREADAVIALTEAERQTLLGLGVDERRVFVTGMGPVLAPVPDGKRFREQHGLAADPVVLFLGQKYAYKGLGALLNSMRLVWARLPETRFVFLGPRTQYSKRLFRDLEDRRVLELDTVSLRDKTDALAACQVLCVPSLQESFGGVLTEAWSLGKPVVAGDIPAVRAVVAEGDDGWLVPQRPEIIAERLLHLLQQPAAAEAMGRRGCEKVNRLYAWPRLAEQTEQVYEHVLRQGT